MYRLRDLIEMITSGDAAALIHELTLRPRLIYDAPPHERAHLIGASPEVLLRVLLFMPRRLALHSLEAADDLTHEHLEQMRALGRGREAHQILSRARQHLAHAHSDPQCKVPAWVLRRLSADEVVTFLCNCPGASVPHDALLGRADLSPEQYAAVAHVHPALVRRCAAAPVTLLLNLGEVLSADHPAAGQLRCGPINDDMWAAVLHHQAFEALSQVLTNPQLDDRRRAFGQALMGGEPPSHIGLLAALERKHWQRATHLAGRLNTSPLSWQRRTVNLSPQAVLTLLRANPSLLGGYTRPVAGLAVYLTAEDAPPDILQAFMAMAADGDTRMGAVLTLSGHQAPIESLRTDLLALTFVDTPAWVGEAATRALQALDRVRQR